MPTKKAAPKPAKPGLRPGAVYRAEERGGEYVALIEQRAAPKAKPKPAKPAKPKPRLSLSQAADRIAERPPEPEAEPAPPFTDYIGERRRREREQTILDGYDPAHDLPGRYVRGCVVCGERMVQARRVQLGAVSGRACPADASAFDPAPGGAAYRMPGAAASEALRPDTEATILRRAISVLGEQHRLVGYLAKASKIADGAGLAQIDTDGPLLRLNVPTAIRKALCWAYQPQAIRDAGPPEDFAPFWFVADRVSTSAIAFRSKPPKRDPYRLAGCGWCGGERPADATLTVTFGNVRAALCAECVDFQKTEAEPNRGLLERIVSAVPGSKGARRADGLMTYAHREFKLGHDVWQRFDFQRTVEAMSYAARVVQLRTKGVDVDELGPFDEPFAWHA